MGQLRLYAPVCAAVATGPSVLDWVSALGQAAGAIGTLAAVGVALWVAGQDGRRLRAEPTGRRSRLG
jgi:hypothetical protein